MQSYQTTDSNLATLLAILGAPWWQTPEGKAVPFLNVYDPGLLKKKGFIGRPILEAVGECLQKGIVGTIHYQFTRTPLLEAVVGAWAKQDAEIKAADFGTAPAPTSIELEPELAARVACLFAANRKHLLSGWQSALPCLVLPGDNTRSEPDPDPTRSGGRVITGSFKMLSLRPWPTDERLKALKLR